MLWSIYEAAFFPLQAGAALLFLLQVFSVLCEHDLKSEFRRTSRLAFMVRGVYHSTLFILIDFTCYRINRSARAGIVSANFFDS
ncbi:MAG: hypothetical protein UT84_C0001G0056 [Candidatus Curtissbacteria bacterium GW2011_GWA1_40_16]|uniref:Uncharacterized protein n=1 Tax=Candidatus Curtissbacteria bacterium GW2011_GWA1_40_16 TaxID=1618405 RepID=A0A0G0RN95_9BACT|nr:MAG: hypothetical protein UT84_C0001G0056 [Candidatus Curtissbacteria bacterium GW2011_GWA1_40_16]